MPSPHKRERKVKIDPKMFAGVTYKMTVDVENAAAVCCCGFTNCKDPDCLIPTP